MAKSKLKGVTITAVTALLIAGLIHHPKEKYSLEQTTIKVSGLQHPPKVKYSLQQPLTITVSGPTHPPKVKYSQKFQMLHIPVTQRQVQVQTSVQSSPHPPRPAAR